MPPPLIHVAYARASAQEVHMKKHHRLAMFYKLWREHCALGFERNQPSVNRMAEELAIEAPVMCDARLAHRTPEIDIDRLVEWIVDHSGASAKPAPAGMFVLGREVDGVEGTTVVNMYPFHVPKNASDSDREAEARRLIDEFIREAEECSSFTGHVERFAIIAQRDVESTPMARTFFATKPKS